MMLLIFPIVGPLLLLVGSYVLALFLRKHLCRLLINKTVAFSAGVVIFLICYKLLSLLLSLASFFIVTKVLSPEQADLFALLRMGGVLGGSDILIRFAFASAFAATALACVIGYKYVSARTTICFTGSLPIRAPVFTRGMTFVSILVCLWALFGQWGPLYNLATVPILTRDTTLWASMLHNPRLCSWMPERSFKSAFDSYSTPRGILCLRKSQSEEEYYKHCNLIPASARESQMGYSGTGTEHDVSPYATCVQFQIYNLSDFFRKYRYVPFNQFYVSPVEESSKSSAISYGATKESAGTTRGSPVNLSGRSFSATSSFSVPVSPEEAIQYQLGTLLQDIKVKLDPYEYITSLAENGFGNIQFNAENNVWFSPRVLKKEGQTTWQFYRVVGHSVSLIEATVAYYDSTVHVDVFESDPVQLSL